MVLVVCLLTMLLPPPDVASAADDSSAKGESVTEAVYASSIDGSKQVTIDFINFNVNHPVQKSNYVALFTSGTKTSNNNEFTDKVFVKKHNVAVSVDADGNVTRVIGPSQVPVAGAVWEDDQYMDIPEDGYVLIASDSSWNVEPRKRANLYELAQFNELRLMRDGTEIDIADLIQDDEHEDPAPDPDPVPIPGEDVIELEAPPEDITIIVQGPLKRIDYIDTDVAGIANIVALFSSKYGDTVTIPQFNVAIQVNADGIVTQMVNAANGNQPPSWTGPVDLEIPQGGYVVMAQDNSYANHDIKKFLATKFKVGDTAKLRKNGQIVSIDELTEGATLIPRLTVSNFPMYTVNTAATVIAGQVTNGAGAELTIAGIDVALDEDGFFQHDTMLVEGTNYIDIVLIKDGAVVDEKTVIVYSRPSLTQDKRIILWVDQAANARKLQSSESVRHFLELAKDAGVTDIAFDVKGVEGFVSYKKNDLTGRPYVSEMTSELRKGSNPNLDLLEEFITHSHALGLKLHAALNVFAEGSITMKEFAVIDDHLDWEERVYRPEDHGEILRLRESDYGRRGLNDDSTGAKVLFVNPANDEVRDYQLKTFEEVLKNYQVDGIMLDRGRYDNETADFSDVSKQKFELFLEKRGKVLTNWPDDIFRYENGKRVDGPLIQDWWEFRSGIIESFVKETRQLVDQYEAAAQRNIELSSYVGAWFESYYLNGVHWGSKQFTYDERLKFPSSSVYTENYSQTGYIEHLDFLMVGTYYSTAQEIQRYITIDSIVTQTERPLYASMALADLQSAPLQREIFQTALGSSDGLMLFDASLANWPIIKASLRDEEYIKDYHLGISKPGDPEAFIEGTYHNVNRNNDDLNVYTEEYGTHTGTNRFGVEVIVNAEGVVTKMANKKQAVDWQWGTPDDNNSEIPAGGMVISTLDSSGVRTLRQLVANTYNVGDEVRAAALYGWMDDDGRTVTETHPTITGMVKVLGAGSSITVNIAGKEATVNESGVFTGTAALVPGENEIEIEVYVDGMKTNAKTIRMNYTPSTTPSQPTSPVEPSPSQPQPGEPGKPNPPDETDSQAQLVTSERGVTIQDGWARSEHLDGKAALRVNLDQDLIDRIIESLQGEHSGNEVMIEIRDTDLAIVSLPAQWLTEAYEAIPGLTWTLLLDNATYEIPASAILSAYAATLRQPDMEHVEIQITVEALTDAEADDIASIIAAEGGHLAGSPHAFSVSFLHGDHIVEVNHFHSTYVLRTITLNAEPGNADVLTAIMVDRDTGEIVFVPARFFVNEDGEIIAHIMRTGNSVYAIASFDRSFSDVEGHWARETIDKLASKQLLKGISAERFAPDREMTRAEYAALLIRTLGLAELAYTPAFQDVLADSWHANAVTTAIAANLIHGYPDDTFRPDQPLTREQLAVLALRAYDFVLASKLRESSDLASPAAAPKAQNAFADTHLISDWALPSVERAASLGLMNGTSAATFSPQETVTRAQAAVVLNRLLVKLEMLDE